MRGLIVIRSVPTDPNGGFVVAKRVTPIERLAAGDALDKNRRWVDRKRAAGYVRRAEWVPADRVPELKAIVRQWAQEFDGSEGPRDD